MKVFSDFHHGQLYESLRILFEDRLGWELFRPIGLEWYRDGFWGVYPHPDTAQQYLGLHLTESYDKFQQANPGHWLNKGWVEKDGIYLVPRQEHKRTHRGISLERFKREKFDIILASIPWHITAYEKLRATYQPQARTIFQQGNMWGVPEAVINHLNSTTVVAPPGLHTVSYHQEFDLQEFRPGPCANPRSVVNLMHCQSDEGRMEFESMAGLMASRGWVFHNHGSGNRDGAVDDVGQTLRDHGFLWHNKIGGEGYGFNAHCAAAIGRPIICHHHLYHGMQVSHLLQDGVKSVDLDDRSLAAVADMLEAMVVNHEAMATRVREHFALHVDFDREFVSIKSFLDNLQ